MSNFKNLLDAPLKGRLPLGEHKVILGAIAYVPENKETNSKEHYEIPMLFPEILDTAGKPKTETFRIYNETGWEIFCNQLRIQLDVVETNYATTKELFNFVKGKTLSVWYDVVTKILEDGSKRTYRNYNFIAPKTSVVEADADAEELPM